MSYNIRPEYSSDEFSDYDEDNVNYIPRKSAHTYKPPEKDYKTQLYESALYDSTADFIKLMKNNSNKFDFDYDGWTLLLHAASHGHHEKMSYLLELGADPNYNYNSFTPFLAVCDGTKTEVELMKCIQVLEKYKVDMNVEDRHGVTPLMYASRRGHKTIVEYLLAKCPDTVNKTDSESLTALFYAVMNNFPDIVDLLLDAKAISNLKDFHGRTALDIAVLKQYNDIIELLHPGYLQQQEEEQMAMNQEKSNQVVNDHITLFKNNLPTDSDLQSTGFYSNVIEMLTACELLDFSTDIIEKQMSLFELINCNDEVLRNHNIHLNYQRNEIFKYMKVFNLQKWVIARSVATKTNKKTIKLDELIHYTYLICEQLYIDYSSLNYIEKHNFSIKDVSEKYGNTNANTLMRLSLTLNKYERFVQNIILKTSCLHPAGLIENTDNSKSVLNYILPVIGLAVIYFSFSYLK